MAWQDVLQSAGISDVRTMTFADAETYLKDNHDKLGLLVIDEDLQTLDPDSPASGNSFAVLKHLANTMPERLDSKPVLCVRDMRARNDRQGDSLQEDHLYDPSSSMGSGGGRHRTESMLLPTSGRNQVSDEASPTPVEERQDPFLSLTVPEMNAKPCEPVVQTVTKPVKNSKLFATLYKLVHPEQLEEVLRNRKKRSNTTSSTASSLLTPGAKRSSSTTSTASDLSATTKPLVERMANVRSLLVDDNPVNQKVVTRMLSRLGVHPDIAQNGKEACDKVFASQETDKPIDLIFMDIWMPEMNGLEASKEIRKQHDSKDSPYIIAMTACVMPGDKEKCIAAGMNGYVSKPVRKDELEAAIHTYTQILTANEQQQLRTSPPTWRSGSSSTSVSDLTVESDATHLAPPSSNDRRK